MSYGFRPYVNKATKLENAAKETKKMRKKGIVVTPIVIAGRTIARSIWGKAWCDALESHADLENRLARGRTYARSGFIVHLETSKNNVTAKVYGSRLYSVNINFEELEAEKWNRIRENCKGQVASLVDLLSGKVPDTVMRIVSEKNQGLFPNPGQMSFYCSCPDWADMCKHVAGALYGVGARLDSEPELIFSLRGVNPLELVPEIKDIVGKSGENTLSEDEIGDIFGIDIAPDIKPTSKPKIKPSTPKKTVTLKPTKVATKVTKVTKVATKSVSATKKKKLEAL